MPYSNKQMLRDANGDLIPQYWDITAGEFKPLTGQDGANDVRLTGSKVEEIFPRKIRDSDVFELINVPSYAKGAIIQLSIHSIVGDISGESDGLSARVRNYASGQGARYQLSDSVTDNQKRPFAVNVVFFPTPEINISDYSGNAGTVHQTVLGRHLRVDALISGDFEEGQGIDMEGSIIWLI